MWLLSSDYNRTFYWAFWLGLNDPAPNPANERNPLLVGIALVFHSSR